MATPVVFNGVNYSIPAFGDVGYAQGPGNLSAYLIAIASGTLQITGGLFSLTADANFGPNFGLVSVYYKSASPNIATAGVLRLANTDTINWRNFANTLDLPLAVNTSNQLTFNGIVISTAAVGGTVNNGTIGRLTLYPATGNTVDDVYVQNAQGIDVLIATQAARSVPLEYTIPNPGNAVAAATFALLELAQTFTATQTFAAATFTGLITAVNANFSGSITAVNATLSGVLTVSSTTNQIVLGTTNTTTITSPAPAASRVYTIPDSGGATQFVMGAGNQTISGVKTFNGGAGAITLSGSTVAMGANKITGLANGTVATDAAAFGQIVGSFVAPTVQKFASGTATYTTPTSPRTPVYIRVRMVGGGGGGGGSGTTGGANGGTGGQTTFGSSLLTANGGNGGLTSNGAPNGGAGGVASIAAGPLGFGFNGGDGGGASVISSGTAVFIQGGAGAGTPFVSGGAAGGANQAGIAAYTNSGAGGGGAATSNTAGVRGGGGGGAGAFIDVVIASPVSTYTYAVGAAGTAGTAGTSGFPGGAGGSGFIIVEEFYQ